jgi:hypothetical protein
MGYRPYASWNGAFVVGTGRCGSTLLSRALALHPDVLSLSEFFVDLGPNAFPARSISGQGFWNLISSREGLSNFLIRIGVELPDGIYPVDGTHRFDRASGVPSIAVATLPALSSDPDTLYDQLAEAVPKFSDQSAAQHYVQLFSLLGGLLNHYRWVERSGASGFIVDRLVSSFPAARYVHITRQLDATVLSMSRHPGFRLTALSLEFITRCGADVFRGEAPAARIPPDLKDLVPERLSKESFESWDPGLDVFRQIASYQTAKIRGALKMLPPEQVLVLSYEDVVRQSEAEFGRLAEFFELDDQTNWSRAAAALVRR